MKIKFKTENFSFEGELNNSLCAKEIIHHLPINSVVSRWGDEIYFDIGFKASADGASMDVEKGDIAYWSQEKSICIFFGPTPLSNTEKPVPASPVVVIGKVFASPSDLRKIHLGERIKLYIDNASS